MTKKKILFVLTKGNWGGAQRYVFDLATHLPSEQFLVKVAVGQGRALPEKLALAGIETIIIPSLGRDISLLDDGRSFFALLKIFRRERPDVVHLNSSKIGGLGALAARLARVPKIIYTAHGWPFNEPRAWLVRALIWLVSWLTVLLTHTTVVITESEKTQGLKMPFGASKIKLIRNGLAAPNFKQNVKHRVFNILTIAELHKNKGLEYLIKALANLPRKIAGAITWRAIIIGEGEERAKLERLIKNEKLENQIKLAGFVKNAAELLPNFDLFVLPSLKEGLPYVILEAGLAGLPVIATRVGGLPEVLAQNEAGIGQAGILVAPKNSRALAAAIQLLIDHPTRRQELGHKLKQRVETEYSLEKMVSRLDKLYS